MTEKLLRVLIMMGFGFLCEKNDFSKIETKSNIFINVYCYENKLVFPIYISDQKFKLNGFVACNQ